MLLETHVASWCLGTEVVFVEIEQGSDLETQSFGIIRIHPIYCSYVTYVFIEFRILMSPENHLLTKTFLIFSLGLSQDPITGSLFCQSLEQKQNRTCRIYLSIYLSYLSCYQPPLGLEVGLLLLGCFLNRL